VVYAKPPLPTLPSAGGKFNDPVFGTEIMRATDGTDGPAPGLGTYYSHWPTFNCNNTKLLIRKGETGDAILKGFDPVNFRLGSSKALPTSIPGGGAPNWESSTWSNIDPKRTKAGKQSELIANHQPHFQIIICLKMKSCKCQRMRANASDASYTHAPR
jgi:hypothetical protein